MEVWGIATVRSLVTNGARLYPGAQQRLIGVRLLRPTSPRSDETFLTKYDRNDRYNDGDAQEDNGADSGQRLPATPGRCRDKGRRR